VELIVRQWRMQLADGTASHEARWLGGGCRGSPYRWWRPRRAGNTVEGGCGEHSRVQEGRVVRTAACDRAARWKRIRAREGTLENFIFFSKVRTRGSQYAIASGRDASVRTDARVKSLS
jgi:hypothetical protein